MERYKLTLAYDGTDFYGSQRQANKPTIQLALEKALNGIGWSGSSVSFAGRTDTGVHASGQVASVEMEWRHTSGELLKAINAKLPQEISVLFVEQAPPHFHPRFSASSRSYRYRIYHQPVRDPQRERYAWRIWPALEATVLNKLAADLVGTHDFAAFGTPPRSGQSTIREVMAAEWIESDDEVVFCVKANAFLYHMVRRLVFAQVAIAQGREPDNALRDLLGAPKRRTFAGLAPACGLTLTNVTYPDQFRNI